MKQFGVISVQNVPLRVGLKVAVYTIVPQSPFFVFCTPKYRLLQTLNKMRSNISVNEMALFGLFAAFVKGKTFFDSHDEK